jgi:hypothetical protein
MPRQRDHFELALYGATLRRMAERIQRDYDLAYERDDIVRGIRHARRIEMIEYALIANSPCEGISTFNSFSRA